MTPHLHGKPALALSRAVIVAWLVVSLRVAEGLRPSQNEAVHIVVQRPIHRGPLNGSFRPS